MTDEATQVDDTVAAYECTRCGERLEGPDDTCQDPLCDGETRRVGTGRE